MENVSHFTMENSSVTLPLKLTGRHMEQVNTELWLVADDNTVLWLVDAYNTDLWLVDDDNTELWLVDADNTWYWALIGQVTIQDSTFTQLPWPGVFLHNASRVGIMLTSAW